MAQFYSLEEAARVLGMSPEELKTKAQHREVRAFLDGGSWRFRVADVDELARRRGLGSDAELHLSDLDLPAASHGDDNLDLSAFTMGTGPADLGQHTTDVHAPASGSGSGSDHDILLDDLSLPPNPVTGSSSVIIGMGQGGKLPSDSDVRLVPDNAKGSSDSDVRLASPHNFKAPSDSDVTLIADDTSSHAFLAAGPGSDTTVRKSPQLGSSAEVPAAPGKPGDPTGSDSDFELTPSSVIDALQPDSGSDFELSALDGSDEFETTPLKPSDSDVTAAEPGLSGINLSRPSDSGINLQGSGLNLGAQSGIGQADSIELAPLSDSEMPARPPAKPKAKPSLSKTPPPGVGKGEKDIFDDTDFEVDALSGGDDSDDKTVQLAAASDFELEESDTGSEVFAIDEEDVDQNAATSIGQVAVDDLDEDEDDGFADATSGEMSGGAWDVESEAPAPAAAGRAAPAAVLAAGGPQAEWGGLWVGMLGVASVLMLFLAFVAMDLVHNLYQLQNDTPASGLVKSLAGLISS